MSDRAPPGAGWHKIAFRTPSSDWNELPGAPWTIAEARIMIAQGRGEERTSVKNRMTIMEVRAR